MGVLKGLKRVIVTFLVVLPILTMTACGQITTACTNSMISSFTPCLNFITGSSGNVSSPTKDCCSALGSLVQSSSDCACLIVTGNVPFRLPINRTMAISLPRACNMASIPLQCKASAAPLPAPGPSAFGPPLPLAPTARAPVVPESPAAAPLPDTSSETPSEASPPTTVAPSAPGLRPVLTPSSASKLFSNMYQPSLALGVLGMMFLKYF